MLSGPNAASVPLPAEREIDAVFALIALLSNPGAAKDVLQRLAKERQALTTAERNAAQEAVALAARRDEIRQLEQQLAQRESELQAESAQLDVKRTAVLDRESRVIAREAELASQQKAFDAEKAAFAEREQRVLRLENNLRSALTP